MRVSVCTCSSPHAEVILLKQNLLTVCSKDKKFGSRHHLHVLPCLWNCPNLGKNETRAGGREERGEGRGSSSSRAGKGVLAGGPQTCTPPCQPAAVKPPGKATALSPSSGWPTQINGELLLPPRLKPVLPIKVLSLSMMDPKTTTVLQGRNPAFAGLC